MVGAADGALDGDVVGEMTGAADGALDGDVVGEMAGAADGALDGEAEVASVGTWRSVRPNCG